VGFEVTLMDSRLHGNDEIAGACAWLNRIETVAETIKIIAEYLNFV
jgi:hypothetical protein